jgi:hypothetical protein
MEVCKISDDIIGRVVISKSGRDQGKAFVVVKVINDRYLSICDGDLRKIENPKKKNIRHLHFTHLQADEVLDCFHKGDIPENHIIKRNIKRILDKGIISGEGGLVSG